MQMKNSKNLLLILIAIVLTAGHAAAKQNVTLIDVSLAEVTADGINIRSGAGTQFPVAHFYSTDWNNRRVKLKVPQAYKGNRFWVRDAGEWWEIDTPFPANGDTKRFISKKFCKLLESDTFDTDSITSPQVWAHVEKVSYGDDDSEEELSQTTIVTIYPGDLVVTQLYHPEGDNIAIGDLNREKTAVFNSINTGLGMTGDDVAPDSPLRIWTMTDFDPPCLMWEIGEKNRSSFTMNGEKFNYIDISGVSPARWKELVAELKKAKNFRSIRQYSTQPEAFVTRDDLSDFVRLK